MSESRYAVILAPGYWRDETRVVSAHRTLSRARRAAGKVPKEAPPEVPRYVVIDRPGSFKGDRVFSDCIRVVLEQGVRP